MDRGKLIRAVAERIERDNELWRQGRATSPDQRDYVLDALDVLEASDPTYTRPSDEETERLAEVLFADCGETYVTAGDIAAFLITELAGPPVSA